MDLDKFEKILADTGKKDKWLLEYLANTGSWRPVIYNIAQEELLDKIDNKSNQILGARTELLNSSGIVNQVVLVSDSEFMADNGGGRSPENHIFILNSIDYLVGDQDLIALRSREITSRPLEDLSDASKKTWKWVNISAPSLLVIGFGLVRIRKQKNRSNVLEELYG